MRDTLGSPQGVSDGDTHASPMIVLRITTNHPTARLRRRPAGEGEGEGPAALELGRRRLLCCCGCDQRVGYDVAIALGIFVCASGYLGLGGDEGEVGRRCLTYDVGVDLPRSPGVGRVRGSISHYCCDCLYPPLFFPPPFFLVQRFEY